MIETVHGCLLLLRLELMNAAHDTRIESAVCAVIHRALTHVL